MNLQAHDLAFASDQNDLMNTVWLLDLVLLLNNNFCNIGDKLHLVALFVAAEAVLRILETLHLLHKLEGLFWLVQSH